MLLLTFLLINPTTTSVSALEGEENPDYDNQISTQTESSGVTISFTPSSGSASLTPTTSDGASAKINVSANIKIASTGGYTIYLGGKNAALTGEKTGQTISAMSGSKTFASLDTNTWGYAVADGSSISDTATYSALPQGQGISLESKSGNQSNIDKTYAISFATKIGNDKPADVYSNQVTLSVTSSPVTVVTFTDFTTTMQGMTSSICSQVSEGAESQLRDTRDGKYYWVGKLADGKCWMTQNLDLDLSTSKALTSSDSDVTTNWTPGYTTATTASSSTVLNDDSGQRSWNLGSYRVIDPTVANDCAYPKNDLSQCGAQFTIYNTPTTANGDVNAHYVAGNYYQWGAVTAGTGANITSGEASGSICPKSWKLPGFYDDFKPLYESVPGSSKEEKSAQVWVSPYYFTRAGGVSYLTTHFLTNAGTSANYWSSSALANGNAIYFSPLSDSSNVYYRRLGYSVRCVAR